VFGVAFRTIAQESGVEELLLEANGLKLLLLPDPATPVVAECIVYHVGSRNEATGHTGATHLLEHLMFKGSRRFDPRSGRPIARTLERVGAGFNATTWFDRTNYYETLSPEHLELALELEADRMRHALLREEDLASEMTVVRNEFERGENEPFDALLKDSFAIAFREHPYHHPTIGWRSDIENASIARLREFYDTFYNPDNATLVVVGAFERSAALGLVERHFVPLPPAPRPVDQTVTAEPAQQGERRFVLRRAGEVGWVAVSWRTPQATHPDTHALAVLADAVASGVTSRLFQRLVEPGTCLDVQAVPWQLRDPGLFQVFATLNQGSSHEAVEEAIRDEVARVSREGIGVDELERATVQVEAHTAYHRDSPTQVSAALAEAVSAASWRFYLDYPERIRAVDRDDVVRVAREYCHDDAVSVGWFVPRNGHGTGGGIPPVAPQSLRPRPCGFRPLLAPAVQDVALPGGARLLVLPRRAKETVHLQGSLLAGHGLLGPEQWSAASLLPDMLERGTASYSRLELARAMEDRGIDLSVSGEGFNPYEVAVSGRCLVRNWRLILELAVEMLRRPTFPAAELDKLRQLRLGELAQSQEDTFLRAFEAFSRLAYPPGHPYFLRPVEERRHGLEESRVSDLARVHAALYGPASLVLAVVGDIAPEEVAGALGELLADWHGGLAMPPELPRRTAADAAPGEVRLAMADKPNLDVLLGHPGGLRRADPDFIAAQLGNSVLGHSTLSSRLGMRLRDREGLTYGVISRFFGASLLDGPWATTFSVAPATSAPSPARRSRGWSATAARRADDERHRWPARGWSGDARRPGAELPGWRA
jgi:zinc protease